MPLGNLSTLPKQRSLNEYSASRVAPAASETYAATDIDRVFLVTTPDSGVGTIKLLPPSHYAGEMLTFKALNTGGGEVKITDAAGTDVVGDNLSAVNDYVLLFSDGIQFWLIKEVTT